MRTSIKTMGLIKRRRSLFSRPPSRVNPLDAVRAQINRIKRNIYEANRAYVRRDNHLLRLSLNEAEALAWQTGFPHLFFPMLAAEKAQAAVAWHLRQKAIQQNSSEIALVA